MDWTGHGTRINKASVLYNVNLTWSVIADRYAIHHHNKNKGEDSEMAKTKSSVRGVQNKKIVVVKGYTRKDGTRVPEHRRSTPN